MATLYQNPSLTNGPDIGYKGYVEPDTSVPPKSRPVLKEISVNGIAISETEILAEAQNHPAEDPGAALIAAARALVVRELLLQEARRLALEPCPEAGADRRTETREDAVIRALIEREIAAPRAGDSECRRFYDRHPERFRSETIYEARHILLAAPASEDAARTSARAQAESLIAHLAEQPQDFARLVLQYSACPSKEQGGNLGQLTRGSTVAEFERALESMEEGELGAVPVESRFGFHIVRLDRKIAGEALPFDTVKERIAGWLEAASWSKAVAQYLAVLAGRAEIRGIDVSGVDGPLVQ